MMKNDNNGYLFIISAPSGAGKTSLTNYVMHTLEPTLPLQKVTTTTTRSPRTGEVNGVDYNFVSLTEFKEKEQHNHFLEVSCYNGHWYGSPADIITKMQQGLSFVIIVDRAGAKKFKCLIPQAVAIWITLDNLEELKKRIELRGSMSQQDIDERLKLAEQECKEEQADPLCSHIIINNDFQTAAQELLAIFKRYVV